MDTPAFKASKGDERGDDSVDALPNEPAPGGRQGNSHSESARRTRSRIERISSRPRTMRAEKVIIVMGINDRFPWIVLGAP